MKEFKGLSVPQIATYLQNADNERVLELWSEYCEDTNQYDDQVFTNDEDTMQMICRGFMDLAQRITYGDYNYSHEFVTLNGYANFESSDYVVHLINEFDLAEWLQEQANKEGDE